MPDKKKILIVEDDQALRDLYITILTDAGYQIESAVDGLTGFEAMKKGGYDLVLLDLVMPKMDGLTVLEKISYETKPENPIGQIVILSNLGKDDAIGKAMSMGAKGYMIKSDYTPDQVVKQINQLLYQE